MKKFITWTFVTTWAFVAPIALSVHSIIPIKIPFALGWFMGIIPGIVALYFARKDGESRRLLNELVRFRASLKDYLLIPFLTFGLLFSAIQLTDLLNLPGPTLGSLNGQTLVLTFVWFILALGEELAWRGYAFPRFLQKYGFAKSTMLLGLIWAVWHYPRIFSNPYLTDFASNLPWLLNFTAQIIFANIILCWLYLRSGRSTFVTTLFHTCWNLCATIHLNIAIDPIVTGLLFFVCFIIMIKNRRAPVMT